eukprot:gene8931-18471_t
MIVSSNGFMGSNRHSTTILMKKITNHRISSSTCTDNKLDPSGFDLKKLLDERNILQNELYIIQAITLRNEAQLGSFVDEEAQWKAQSEVDRQMLLRRPYVESRIDLLDEQIKIVKQLKR